MKIIFTIACLLLLPCVSVAQQLSESQLIKNGNYLPSDQRPRGRDVRIFAQIRNKVILTGDTVPATAITQILFTREECPLPLADKRGMYRAWMAYGSNQLGCWYPTIDGGFVFVGQLASLTHDSNAPWAVFPRAKLHDDGSATITEPNYNSATFLSNWLDKRNAHLFDHVHDKP
jgi:hypothetical protein